MSSLENIKKVYLIGIGGIGMSALARYFYAQGLLVAGYDLTPSPLTEQLQNEGMHINYSEDIDSIPEHFLSGDAKEILVIYTPAIPHTHSQLLYFLENNYQVEKRAKVLGEITKEKFTIAVAGTHGKTSTATFISHALTVARIPHYAFLGGISTNYQTNFIKPENQDSGIAVVEADEFDRSFHHLHPDISVVTSLEADHLDIYQEPELLHEAYQQFIDNTKPNGLLIYKYDLQIKTSERFTAYTFAVDNAAATFEAFHPTVKNRKYTFTLRTNEWQDLEIQQGVPGDHYLLNILAGIGAVKSLVRKPEVIAKAAKSFLGVKRRFEYLIDDANLTYIDDYAHHPTEIAYTYRTVKKLYPHLKITAIFQPHLYSRTRDFAEGFAKAIEPFDHIILLDIYPAREKPIEGITSDIILDKINNPAKKLLKKEELPAYLKNDDSKVYLTIGAGDIHRLTGMIQRTLKMKNP